MADHKYVLKDSLEELARIQQPEARSKLIRTLVSEYARSTDHEPSEIERELFCNIVLAVFDQLDRPARYELVVRLANTHRITSDLADRLAHEDYELSEPVIEYSPAISQSALKELAQSGSDRHRISIGLRTDLTEDLTDKLIARGTRAVVLTLLGNLSAPFSIKANLAFLIFANTDPQVLGAIAKRALDDSEFLETQTQIIETQCPLVPAALQAAIESNSLEKLAEALTDRPGDNVIEIDGTVFSKHEASVQIANGELSFDAIIKTLLTQQRMDAVVWLVGRKTRLETSVVEGTFKSDADVAIMMLMLETGLEADIYKEFLKARCAWLDRSPRAIPDLVMRFKTELRKPRRTLV